MPFCHNKRGGNAVFEDYLRLFLPKLPWHNNRHYQ